MLDPPPSDATTTTTGPGVDPTAVVGRRFLAAVIDLGILWIFSATFWLLASHEVPPAFDRLGVSPCRSGELCTNVNGRYVEGWPMALLIAVWVAYLVGVFVLQRGLTGRTVGTMLTGVVVVGEDGRPLGIGRALLRSVAGIVDYLPCCVPVVGIATSATTAGHRRVGDMAASSHVVAADAFGRPVTLPQPTPSAPVQWAPPPGYPAQPPTPPSARPPVAPAPPFTPPPSTPPTVAPWSSPSSPPSPMPTTAPDPAAGPVWDPDRRAYLQWDPARQQWLQFDQASQAWQQYDTTTGRWLPIEG